MKHLHLIIDPQNDFIHLYGNYASRHGSRQIIEAKKKINVLSASKHLKSIIVRAEYSAGQFIPGVSIATADTFGYEIDAAINVQDTFAILTKNSHSCFSSRQFTDALNNIRPDTLVISGFLAEYCVKETASDALAACYQVILVTDAIGTGDDVQSRRSELFREFKQKGCILMDAADCYKFFEDNH